MQDITYVAVSIAFFALCVAYVRGLDRLVRNSDDGEQVVDVAGSAGEVDGELFEVRS